MVQKGYEMMLWQMLLYVNFFFHGRVLKIKKLKVAYKMFYLNQ
jgi:hypothetical protein